MKIIFYWGIYPTDFFYLSISTSNSSVLQANFKETHIFKKIMKAMFCSGILLYIIYHIGHFTADTRLSNFRWQNAKQ